MIRIYLFPQKAQLLRGRKRRQRNLLGDLKSKSRIGHDVFQMNRRMERQQRRRTGDGVESEDGLVCNDAVWTSSAQAQLLAALSANEAGAREVSDRIQQLALVVPQDHHHALGQRGDVVSARAAVEIADLPVLVFQEGRVDVA